MSEDLSGLNLVELLERLEPVPEPPPIPLWPQTAGWIWLGLALTAAAAWLLYRWIAAHRAEAYRRAALREVAAAGDDPAVLAEVLRRTALAAFPRAKVAALYGEAWLAFLDETCDGTAFRRGAGRAFAVAPYATTAPQPGLAPVAADWIRRHRRPKSGIRRKR
ncbi:DUF4381 domain-containing protein [Algihabitans albus]|uniref:DUF4381 domain-containing protein n=1 Tax=Algihabitans albus TaxID=2164067 RepID=UPI000E5C6C4C|nr:DUF4381 domain-containing protein [Algihabitans albus]